MSTPRMQYESKGCHINSDFGKTYAMKVFKLTEEELETLVGRFTRGPRKGLLRGYLTWFKTTKGGWVKTGAYDHDAQQGHGFIAPPGKTFGHGINVNGKTVIGFDYRAELDQRSSSRGLDPVVAELRNVVLGRKPTEPVKSEQELEDERLHETFKDCSDEEVIELAARRYTQMEEYLEQDELTAEETSLRTERMTRAFRICALRGVSDKAYAAIRAKKESK